MSLRAAAIAVLALLAVLPGVTSAPAGASDRHWSDRGKTVLFANAYIRPDETIDGDLNVIFGDAQIAGRVRGDVNTIFGRCTTLPGAVILGEEHCVNSDVARAFEPWLAGPTFDTFAAQDHRLFVKLGSNAIVLLIFLLFPLRMRIALDRVERTPGAAAVVGTIAVVAALPFALLLLVSIIGIPLIALEIAGLIAGVWLGTGAVALLVGRRLAELVWPAATPSPLWALVLGLIVVSAAETVPILGWAVTAVVCLVGLGAAILAYLGPRWSTASWGPPIGGPPRARA